MTLTLERAQHHGALIAKELDLLHQHAERLGDTALAKTVHGMHIHLAAARKTVATHLEVDDQTVAPDGGGPKQPGS